MRPVAYLVSDYHAPSHTFVRREVAALRDMGQAVQPFSIRGSEGAGKEVVPTVLGRSVLLHLGAFLAALMSSPLRLLAAWRLSLVHRPPGLRALVWSQFHFIEAVTLARLLKRSDAKRLHSHFSNSGATVGLLAARIAGIPWSLTLHGISETDYPAGVTLPAKLRAADHVAIASRFMKAQAMRVTTPDVWPRFRIVHCGVDPAIMPARRTNRAPDAPPQVVCVGRLSPEKGYSVLVEALVQLRENGMTPHISIIGDGPSRRDFEADLARNGLDAQVTLHGAQDEALTLDHIAGADMLVLPSLMEGLPVVLIEAMAIGVPVIASRVAGIPELVEHDVTGLCFTPTDSSGLAAAIARLAADPQLAERLATAGKQRVEASYTIAGNAERMRAMFADGATL